MDEGRTCGVISFELTGGRDAAVRFMDSLKLANIATHVAASKINGSSPSKSYTSPDE